ncbi:MAG: VOC family protein [Saprospiraceae bacterium]|nr:VOC family protein [Saprospiraceae bacterium]MCB9325169.1 VOC family protein [Lewinellaceae bacterium]
MSQKITNIAIIVKDYDEAIDFYTRKLGFVLVEDTTLNAKKRWVRVCPKGDDGCCILLAKASTERQKTAIGNQSAGRVFLFLHTDNFDQDFKNLLDHKIKIVRQPVVEAYGKVAVFEDLYGNLWDLVQPL